jgi:hypothetical protein
MGGINCAGGDKIRRGMSHPLPKTEPQRVAHPGAFRCLTGAPPAGQAFKCLPEGGLAFCFFIAHQVFFLLGMNTQELLKAFLQLPELSTVGNAQERAAFTAVRLDGRTVREAGEAIGVSKSQVMNLVDLFQAKLATRMMELRRKRIAVSAEYRVLYRGLYGRLCEVRDESGSDDDWDDHKVGDFSPGSASREDLAELTGAHLRDPDK